ncbi:MAG: DUF2130 domain-containing protein, partial [Vulcanimicrobiaceae bacterium]
MTSIEIVCPECKAHFLLDENVALPVIEKKRAEADILFRARTAELERKEAKLLAEKEELAQAIEAQLAQRLPEIRNEAKKAALDTARIEVQSTILSLEEKAAQMEATSARNAELMAAITGEQKRVHGLEQSLRELNAFMEIEIGKREVAAAEAARIDAVKNAQLESELKAKAYEIRLTQMTAQVKDLQEKLVEGSSQVKGEALEQKLESALHAEFPNDVFENFEPGKAGADTLQRVRDAMHREVGSILYESKFAKTWNNSWIEKLKSDQQRISADIAVLVTTVMPANVSSSFIMREGVAVCRLDVFHIVARLFRDTLLRVDSVR